MSTPAAAIPAQAGRPEVNPWLIAIAVMSATFMEVLDTSVANVALPHIAGNLSASTDESTWVLTSYLISNAIILPATGWLTSFFGRKRLLVACTVIFTLSSVLCGAATSLGFLVIARVIQGIGGGVLQPTAQAVLMESFPPHKRGQAMAAYAMGVVVAPIIGPTLGGWITDNYSWRWIFYINVPVGIVSVMLTQAFISDPPYLRRDTSKRIDYLGFGLMAVGLGALQLVLDKGQQEDWFSSPLIVWGTILACLTLVLFVIRELIVRDPIVDLRTLANRNFRTGTILMVLSGSVLFSTTALLPLFLQTLLGYSSMDSGMAVSPRGLGAMASMFIVGRMVGRVDGRKMMAGGFAALALSVWLLSDINLDITQAAVIWPNVLGGLAMGFIFVPLTTTAVSTLRTEQLSQATGLFSLMRNLGGGLGISAGTTLIARYSQMHQAMLVSHMTPYDPVFQQRWQQMHGAFAAQAGSAAGAQMADATMYGMLVKQALLMAFIDNFRILTVSCLICIPLVFLFKKGQGGGGAGAMH